MIKEIKLQRFCNEYFRELGFVTREEFPFLFKVADLFCLNEMTGECIAVEVKIRNWQQALNQALVYQMMADYVYIAIYDKHVRAVDCDLLISKGIGLMTVSDDGKVELILEAPASPKCSSYFLSSTVAVAFPGRGSLACLMI